MYFDDTPVVDNFSISEASIQDDGLEIGHGKVTYGLYKGLPTAIKSFFSGRATHGAV